MRSKNMSKKSRIGIISILSLTIILSTIGFNNNVFALENNETVYEAKVYSSATIEDNFDSGSIIVILDKSISEVNKVHSEEFFLGVDIESIAKRNE